MCDTLSCPNVKVFGNIKIIAFAFGNINEWMDEKSRIL